MAESESGQDKTEEATPKRIRESREKGQVARSKELNTAMVMLAGSSGVLLFGEDIGKGIVNLLTRSFSFDPHVIDDQNIMLTQFQSMIYEALWLLAPFLAILLVSTIVGPAIIGGLNFSLKSIKFKGEKLNPLKGMKNLFSLKVSKCQHPSFFID